MLKFANRLSPKQIESFITSNGFLVHGLTLVQTPQGTMKGNFDVASYKFEFVFSDIFFRLKNILYKYDVVKKFEEYEADISSEDWQCFMRECFGLEYTESYFSTPRFDYNLDASMDEAYLSKITIEDICSLLGDKVTLVSCIKEVKSFDANKRRFKFYNGTETREVTISFFYDDSSIKKYISEEKFLRFMFDKFGDEFSKYYNEVIKHIENSLGNTVDKSSLIWVYKENKESLECKKYLARKIFGR